MLVPMLTSKPIGAGKLAIERWHLTNRMTVEMFFTFWLRVSADLEFPGLRAGEDEQFFPSYTEWEGKNDYGLKFKC